MRKVYFPQYDSSVGRMFKEQGYSVVASMDDKPSLVCFVGGADVGPGLYGHKQHHSTVTHDNRDIEEDSLYNALQDLGIPSVGICRGGQFLNVMNGGTMYQDVSNHLGTHKALVTGDIIEVSSTHHQMMCPGKNAIILGIGVGTAATRTIWDTVSGEFKTTEFVKDNPDIEVLSYGTDLCFQPHPEFALFRPSLKPMEVKFFQLIDKVCFKGEPQTQ